MTRSIIAFIFARGGSKGLPRKNVLPFLGKPLIARTIEQALSVDLISDVIVSTDDAEIADISFKAGASVPFLRPSLLATDTCSEWLAWQHALKYVQEKNISCDVFLSLPPTSPLRTVDDIYFCIESFTRTSPDMLITVTPSARNPYFNMVQIGVDSSVKLASEGRYHRRQDAPQTFDISTVAYVAKPEFILKSSFIFDGNIRAVSIPNERAIDIDNNIDFALAEMISLNIKNTPPATLL